MEKTKKRTPKEEYTYQQKKATYDKWRKENPLKQAWHQFNHNRRIAGKEPYLFEEYVALRYESKNLNKNGKLNMKFTSSLA